MSYNIQEKGRQNVANVNNGNPTHYLPSQQSHHSDTQEILSQSNNILYGGQLPEIGHDSNNVMLNMQQQNSLDPTHHTVYQSQGQGQQMGQNTCTNFNRGMHSAQVNQPVSNNSHDGQWSQGTPVDNGQGIPAWAAHLCQQVNNIHGVVNNQNQKWQTLETSIKSQNDRLTKIEYQLSEMATIRQDVSQVKSRFSNIQTEVNTLKSKVTEYDQTVQKYSDMCDDAAINSSTTEIKINKMAKQLEKIQTDQVVMKQAQKDTNDRITDVQWRSMRENLIFSGIPEGGKEENCEQVVKEFLYNCMKIDKNIPFDRVHRLGKFDKQRAFPRPIVAKFTFYKDKEFVKQTAPDTLTDTDYYVNDHFPQEIERERKKLYPIAKAARKISENKVRLVREKLFVNDKRVFPPSENSRTQNHGRQERSYQPRNQNNYTAPTGNDHNSNRTTWSRTFTRSKRIAPNNSSDDVIFVENRYAPLRDVTDDGIYTPKNLAGKSKARSPLEEATLSKKQKDSAQSDSDESTNSTIYSLEIPVPDMDKQSPENDIPLSEMDTQDPENVVPRSITDTQPPENDPSDTRQQAADDSATGGSDSRSNTDTQPPENGPSDTRQQTADDSAAGGSD